VSNLQPNPLELLLHRLTGWRMFKYPPAPPYPQRPWHPDGDVAFVSRPQRRLEHSALYLAHLERHGPLRFDTGSVKPTSDGRVGEVRLNVARPDDPVFEVVDGTRPGNLGRPGTLWVHRGDYAPSSPWGARVRIGEHMLVQGHPMIGYSDRKLHVLDPIERTITEVQHLEPWPNGSMRCHGVTQYRLDVPSTDPTVRGSSAAKHPLAEASWRFDEVVLQGFAVRGTMAVNCASRARYIPPALGTDGPSSDVDAVPMGACMRLRDDKARELEQLGGTQLRAVVRCLNGPGVLIVDTGANNSMGVEADARWNQTELAPLRRLRWADFEAWQL
jgi:hypothetical protein